jgi:hypothetical protein
MTRVPQKKSWGRGFCVDGRWVLGNASIYRGDTCLWPSGGTRYNPLLIPDSWLGLNGPTFGLPAAPVTIPCSFLTVG